MTEHVYQPTPDLEALVTGKDLISRIKSFTEKVSLIDSVNKLIFLKFQGGGLRFYTLTESDYGTEDDSRIFDSWNDCFRTAG